VFLWKPAQRASLTPKVLLDQWNPAAASIRRGDFGQSSDVRARHSRKADMQHARALTCSEDRHEHNLGV